MNGFSLNLQLPDLWQQEAVRGIRAGRDVIVDAPTGAGKTRIFELLVESGTFAKGQMVYTVPTRALANDKRLEWQRKGWQVGIITGEISENGRAPVIVATLETQRERLLRGDGPKVLVIDEYQMLADPVRGLAYEMVMTLAPLDTRLLLLSGSVANAKDVGAWLERLGRKVEIVKTRERPVPLEEMAVEQLGRRAPKQLTGYWPRLAAEVLMSGLGPLLIFAPHRKDAEKIARGIAGGLPVPDRLNLTREQEHILGKDFAPMLQARVGCHHSGLSWQQRAGIIEPLAKAGQLRVVVATMGLAAGINFSMRSVIVADTRYFDGQTERDLAPDELLQMFGRAGRRGLDDTGYVIVSNRSPRLMDASARFLKRSNQVDWPTLLRVMDRAGLRGDPPFEAAERFCAALFSKQKIVLGFETESAPVPVAPAEMRAGPLPSRRPAETVRPDQHAMFGLGPTRVEILNSRNVWEEKRRDRLTEEELGKAWMHFKNQLEPVLEIWHFVSDSFPVGRVCRLKPAAGGFGGGYGREIALAMERTPGRYSLTKSVRSMTGRPAGEEYARDELEELILPLLTPHLVGGTVVNLIQRQEILSAQIGYAALKWPVYVDLHGVPLVSPEERTVVLETTGDYTDAAGTLRRAGGSTAVYAWRKLGLILEDGTPTRRGLVFSCFQGGEGLAIAAALEDESYPLVDLAVHIANLRGGHRFTESDIPGGSSRLAQVTLRTYGAANYEGYLEAGLPAGYGEGTAEIIAGRGRYGPPAYYIGTGDLERALTEWISLLRQVSEAPDWEWDRWRRFKTICAAELKEQFPHLPSRELPHVPAAQLTHVTAHHIVGF
ncbi:MAG: DEAD/DEAH box helicase [Verrucomicrobiaceae bacterium]|nr:MAG: DEAD/DEAH box helicase [Verrucomicrobiaceae bacterium]